MNKKCLYCHKIIEKPKYISSKSWNNRKYCNQICTGLATGFQKGYTNCNKGNINLPVNKCQRCGKEFKDKWYDKNRKFCSYKCSELSKIRIVVYECNYCNKKFEDNPSTKRKYCSIECLRKKDKTIIKKCLICNKEMRVVFNRIKTQKFCSRQCRNIFYKNSYNQIYKTPTGASHHAWEGGKSFEPYGIEFNNKLKEKIRIRDNYTCQECRTHQNKLRYKLCIHHIDYNKRNNKESNLISLCTGCNSKVNHNRINWMIYFRGYLTGVLEDL